MIFTKPVIPANAGIQLDHDPLYSLDPRLRGDDKKVSDGGETVRKDDEKRFIFSKTRQVHLT